MLILPKSWSNSWSWRQGNDVGDVIKAVHFRWSRMYLRDSAFQNLLIWLAVRRDSRVENWRFHLKWLGSEEHNWLDLRRWELRDIMMTKVAPTIPNLDSAKSAAKAIRGFNWRKEDSGDILSTQRLSFVCQVTLVQQIAILQHILMSSAAGINTCAPWLAAGDTNLELRLFGFEHFVLAHASTSVKLVADFLLMQIMRCERKH